MKARKIVKRNICEFKIGDFIICKNPIGANGNHQEGTSWYNEKIKIKEIKNGKFKSGTCVICWHPLSFFKKVS